MIDRSERWRCIRTDWQLLNMTMHVAPSHVVWKWSTHSYFLPHRQPVISAHDALIETALVKMTKSMNECEKLFRLMCFNVFAHNRDDHSKNFSYLYHEKEKSWRLSPAYDLTYSNSIGGEHATTINNNGSTPSMDDLLAVAKKIGLHPARSKKIASDIRDCVHDMLGNYLM